MVSHESVVLLLANFDNVLMTVGLLLWCFLSSIAIYEWSQYKRRRDD